MSFLSKLFGFKKPSKPEPELYDVLYENDCNWGDEYFAGIINEANFPGYTIERDVHPAIFDASAHPKCYPVTFLIKKDGGPVLAVMIMKMNQMNAMIARGTYSILEEQGIKYVRFFREMKNERFYVMNRVQQNLY